MRTTTKSRTPKRETNRGAESKEQMIFAHRPATTYVLGLSRLTAQEIIWGALPGNANAGDIN